MHKTVQNLIEIQTSIKSKILDLKEKHRMPKIIAVSKTFKIDKILPLIDYGHTDFGENKVQEALEKWTEIKNINSDLKLHLDSEKLAKKISEEQIKQNLKPKIFIQINIGNEQQKSGILKNDLIEFYDFSKRLGLNIIGTMCIPPFGENSSKYFSEMCELNKKLDLTEISMGMSSDYLNAIEFKSTYLRIGSNIFGQRS